MMRISRGLALTSLCLSLAACGSSKFYTLPTDPYTAPQTQTMIGACATQFGLESYQIEQGVAVKYDDTASLYYHYDGQNSYGLQVVVDDKKLPPSELDKKFFAAKSRGDELYACAQSRLQPAAQPTTVVNVVAPAAAPAPSAGMSVQMNVNVNANVRGTCAQALECYTQLARTICGDGATNCSVKAKFSGNDETACRDALLQVPNVLQPFTMMRPGLTAPEVCRAE